MIVPLVRMPRIERRLAAISGANITAYSALMERNEEDTHNRVGAELERFRDRIETGIGTQDVGPAGTPVEYRPSLAVLPFRTLQPDQSDAYFAEGIVDDIISALGGLKDLVVIARSSTQTYAFISMPQRTSDSSVRVTYGGFPD